MKESPPRECKVAGLLNCGIHYGFRDIVSYQGFASMFLNVSNLANIVETLFPANALLICFAMFLSVSKLGKQDFYRVDNILTYILNNKPS